MFGEGTPRAVCEQAIVDLEVPLEKEFSSKIKWPSPTSGIQSAAACCSKQRCWLQQQRCFFPAHPPFALLPPCLRGVRRLRVISCGTVEHLARIILRKIGIWLGNVDSQIPRLPKMQTLLMGVNLRQGHHGVFITVIELDGNEKTPV